MFNVIDDGNSIKPIVKPLLNNHLLIEENKRITLKSFLEDHFIKIEKMEDFTNMKENISLIEQNASNIPSDDEEYFTLSQCLYEINKPEPETEIKTEPDELLNALQQVIDHKKDDFSSNDQFYRDDTENIAMDTHFSDDFQENNSFSCVKVKEEPIENSESNNDFGNQPDQKSTETEKINHESFQTPQNTKSLKTVSKSTGRIRSRKYRLSSLKIEQTNRKITDFFPIASKSKSPMPTNTLKSKLTNADNLFILSAVQGDGNFCILCHRKFSAAYLKTHLINQHEVSKDIFIAGRSTKKEDTEENCIKDKV